MECEEDTGCSSQSQNIHDLQSYLVTFNKEIVDTGDDVLSSMGVDEGVSDLYNPTSSSSLQEPGETEVSNQFTTGFYSEQGILGNTLADESGTQIQSLVNTGDVDTDMSEVIKQEVGAMDIDSVQAQISDFGDVSLSAEQLDVQTDAMSQGLIMASLNGSLDPESGKVIRIVSMGEDSQFLSMGNGQQMQILSHEDLRISSEALSASNSSLGIQGSDAGIIKASQVDLSLMGSLTGSTTSNSLMMDTGLGAMMVAPVSQADHQGGAQLYSLPTAVDGTRLLSLSHGTTLSSEGLQMSGLLSAENLGSDLGYQTITIMPSDLNQTSEMNYVLIMAPQEGERVVTQSLAPQIVDLKHETEDGLSGELVQVNGWGGRVLRVTQKKFTNAVGPQLMCSYCNYTSPKRYLLTRHMKSHSEERPHKCSVCHRGFKTPASLLNHVNTHTGTRPHKCKSCEAAFTTSGELVRHIRYRHTFEKPHRCPNCDYASVELSKLKRHMRSHTGERPYKCPNCPYASPDTYKLKRHLRIHTGEKPYECDICHARFTQSNSLKAHKLIHTGNKPVFQCNLCPTTCGRKTDLKIHFNKLHSVGSPLECKKCGKVFSDRYSYKQHVRSHDGERGYKCEDCDFVANSERALDLHAAIHTEGKSIECEVCHAHFNLQHLHEKHKNWCRAGTEHTDNSHCFEETEKNVQLGFNSQIPSFLQAQDKEKPGTSKDQSRTLDKVSDSKCLSRIDDSSNSSGEGESSSQKIAPPSASDTLHQNILQDIKSGKLGDVPQVVIVHPDGSLEEISSKFPGSKLTFDDILSTLSNSEKEDQCLKENTSRSGEEKLEIDEHSSEQKKTHVEDDLVNKDHSSSSKAQIEPSFQCEAGTQAEIESDTDSVEDETRRNNIQTQVNMDHQGQIKPVDTEISIENSSSHIDNQHLEFPVVTSASQMAASANEISSDNLQSSSNVTTMQVSPSISSTPTSLPTTTNLQPTGFSNEMCPVYSSSAIKDMNTAHTLNSSQPPYAVIKGYTYVGDNSDEPTYVNLAVDRDSMMKLIISLGQRTNDSGQPLILPTAENVPSELEKSDTSKEPKVQQHLSIPASGASTFFLHQDENCTAKLCEGGTELGASDSLVTVSNSGNFDFVKGLKMNLVKNDKDGTDEISDKDGTDEISDKAGTDETSDKDGTDETSDKDGTDETSDKEIEVESKLDTYKKSDLFTNSMLSPNMTAENNKCDNDKQCDILKASLSNQEPDHLKDNSETKNLRNELLVEQSEAICSNDLNSDMNIFKGQTDEQSDDISKLLLKRTSKKRSEADPSLVMTGKRIRKALVKVSL